MTSIELEAGGPAPAARRAGALALTLAFSATLFLSAFLLFSIQPMFTKMVLPILGGSPAVWSVAMVFFQAILLGGYVWAHGLTRVFGLRLAIALHLGLTTLALSTLPIALSQGVEAPPVTGQAIWLIGVFAAAVGLPFFALSANGPLLQAWFARSGHPGAENPYTLYGASNIGSFGALIAYPFLIEPFAGLRQQSALWSAGFIALLACLGLCGALALKGAGATRAPATPMSLGLPSGWTWRQFAGWTLLAALPSGLLVAVTAHISTDVAAAPLLWVLPLALYLVTFVIAFRDRFILAAPAIAPVQIFATLLMLTFLTFSGMPIVVTLVAHLAFFFVATLLCHRALYDRRPAHSDLTIFYVALSLGGVAGGLFAGLLAPALFAHIIEYPLLIAATLILQPSFLTALKSAPRRAFLAPTVAAAALVAITWLAAQALPPPRAIAIGGAAVFVAAILRWRSASHLLAQVAALIVIAVWLPQILSQAQSWRSFFGVHKVREITHEGARFRTLMHGTTMHGAVRIDAERRPAPADRPLPTTYYSFEGPIGEALAAVRARAGALPVIHAVGLGVGALACHRKAGEEMVFFEIDPAVIRIARDRALFNFLAACAPAARIVTGDARLTIGQEATPANVIVIDAFSSDAIPVHLLTKEAFAVYLSKLTPDGALIFHVSNNTMDLTPVIARVAHEFGLLIYRRIEIVPGGADAALRASSIALAIARDREHLGAIAQAAPWRRIFPDASRRPWTDDYSTILEPILDARRSR